MRATLFGLALLAVGCDRWEPCALPGEWRVDIRRASSDVAARTSVRPSKNGESLVLITDQEPVRVADMTIEGSHLLQVGRDGAILGLAPVDVDGRAQTSFAVTDDGRALVLNGSRVLAYGADLAPAWTYPIPDAASPYNSFSIASTGESAAGFQSSAGVWRLRYLGVDGRERWTVARTSPGDMRFDVNANVIVDDGLTAVRYAAADGAPLEPATPRLGFYQRDGSSVVVSRLNDDGFAIARFAADGSESWTRTFPRRVLQWNSLDGQGPAAIVGASGDVVLSSVKFPDHTNVEQTEVVRLAGDSGHSLDTFENCDAFLIVSSDADGYIATGGPGGSFGIQRSHLARYPWP